MEMQQAGGYESVMLRDRAGTGNCEFIFDGVRFTLKPGKPTIMVPRFVAEWLLRSDQQKVHTTDGQYVCRFGIEDGPDDLLESLGADAVDCSPITLDTTRLEGWDAESQDPQRDRAKVLRIKAQPRDYEHQGMAAAGTFSGKERGSAP